MQTVTETPVWPLWKCIRPEKQAQFLQDIWEKFGIDLLKEDKPVVPVTYSGKLEDIDEIDHLMRQTKRHFQ